MFKQHWEAFAVLAMISATLCETFTVSELLPAIFRAPCSGSRFFNYCQRQIQGESCKLREQHTQNHYTVEATSASNPSFKRCIIALLMLLSTSASVITGCANMVEQYSEALAFSLLAAAST